MDRKRSGSEICLRACGLRDGPSWVSISVPLKGSCKGFYKGSIVGFYNIGEHSRSFATLLCIAEALSHTVQASQVCWLPSASGWLSTRRPRLHRCMWRAFVSHAHHVMSTDFRQNVYLRAWLTDAAAPSAHYSA